MWLKNKKSKFARRMTWRIILIFTICNIMIFGLVLLIVIAGERVQAGMHAIDMINNINRQMETMVTTVEVSARNNVNEIEENLSSPDRVIKTLKKELRLNPHYLGCFVAFEADYYASQGRWFEPYVFYRDSTHIECKQVGSAAHDYLNREWYAKGLESENGYWSEPYQDEDVSNTTLCSYVQPIHDHNGRKIGIFGVDIPMEWLSDLMHDQMTSQTFYNNFYSMNDSVDDRVLYSFIIGRKGQYIVHPDKEKILKDSYEETIRMTADTLDDVVYRNMLAGKSSTLDKIKKSGSTYFISYAPIKQTGWTMAVIEHWTVVYVWAIAISIFILLIVIIGGLIIFFTTQFTIWHSTKPLRYLTESVNEVAQGNFDTPLPEIRHNDEIRQLRDSFETMQHSLANYMEELKQTTAQKASVENELKIAHDIQMAMLPKTFPPFPERSDIEIYGELTPAKAVGGDLYDFYIRDEKLFFCIGDVSGKGIPASLVMAVTRSLFRNISTHVAEPEIIVSALNDSLNESNSTSIFVTFFVGVLDLPTGCLRYCNAGHDAPYLINPDSDEPFTKLPVKSHLPIAAMPEWKYSRQETMLTPGTTIFLFTDGVVEAENREHQQFKMARLQQVFSEADAHPESLVKAVECAVHQFVGDAEQSDDLTMLAIMYTRKQMDVKLKRQLTLSNDVQETPLLGDFVTEVCESLGIDSSTSKKMNLAIEEAVVNVMSYAYPDGTQGEVRIMAEADDLRLKIVISDDGQPFDPTAYNKVDISKSAEDRDIGGLGIHLMRRIMDSINYERVNGQNIFTLCKKLGCKQ